MRATRSSQFVCLYKQKYVDILASKVVMANDVPEAIRQAELARSENDTLVSVFKVVMATTIEQVWSEGVPEYR